jgi:hypothetical protein
MATIISQKLNGIPIYGFRNSDQFELNAQFGINAQASLNITSWEFSNNERTLNSDILRTAHDTLPTEGAIFELEVSDGVISFPFRFICDYKTEYTLLSENTTRVALKLDKSIQSLIDLNGADITMSYLEYLGELTTSDYINHPYVVENRKTLLEKVQILATLAFVIKSTHDEIFKLIAISSDFPTIVGTAQAIINLALTISNLLILSLQIIDLIKQINENFFPPIRYHSAIELKKFITKACEYLGYTVEYGTWLENPVLIPSKNDEIGNKEPNTTDTQSGILKIDDYGHSLDESFEIAKQMANVDLAIIGDVLHCRPKSDPFWLESSGYVMPDVLIENDPLYSGGQKRFNREELKAATTIEYVTDDSDYWTIQKLANDYNGDRISTTIVVPETIVNKRRVNIGNSETITIPYSLAVRKNTFSDLLESFSQLSNQFQAYVDAIKDKWESVEDIIEQSPVDLGALPEFSFARDGALRVENHFFSTPKISILELVNGRYRIPEDFNYKIGAKSIYNKYYKWNSLVSGVRNPDDPEDTNGKLIHEGVRIPFNLINFNTILNLGYFTTSDGKLGKFINAPWNVNGDFMTADFWIQENWANNIKEEQV